MIHAQLVVHNRRLEKAIKQWIDAWMDALMGGCIKYYRVAKQTKIKVLRHQPAEEVKMGVASGGMRVVGKKAEGRLLFFLSTMKSSLKIETGVPLFVLV